MGNRRKEVALICLLLASAHTDVFVFLLRQVQSANDFDDGLVVVGAHFVDDLGLLQHAFRAEVSLLLKRLLFLLRLGSRSLALLMHALGSLHGLRILLGYIVPRLKFRLVLVANLGFARGSFSRLDCLQ
jgi:hypothetical protein